MLLARIIFVCVLVFDIGMSARLASGQNCYNSQAERNFELRSVQSYIRDLQSRPSSDGYTSIARNGGIDLQRLQNDERRISSTPICSPGTTGYAGSSSGYGHGIPPQEIARATVEIAEFAQRDAERAQREIEANRQYYSAERDRTQKEFAALHNDLESQLRGIEASERGGGARDRSRDPQEMQRQADARAQYYQQRQQLIDALVGKGLDSTAAESAVDNFGESVQRSAADAALDAAMQNPNSFTPGEAFRGYPASLGSPLEGGRGELPSGALPPTDPLDQYDPLMNPHWGTDANGHSVQGGTLDELLEHQKQAQTEAAGTGAKVNDAAGIREPPPIGDTVKSANADTVTSKVQADQNPSNPLTSPDADPAAPAPDSDAAKPGYSEAVAEMRQQDGAYSAKVQAEMSDPNSRAGQVMQGDWSGVGEDMRSQQQSGSRVQPNATTTSSAAGGSTSALDPTAGPFGSSIPPAVKSAPNPILAANSTQARTSSGAARVSPAGGPSPRATNNPRVQTALPPAAGNGGTPGMSLDEALRTEGPLRHAYEPQSGSVSNPTRTTSGQFPVPNPPRAPVTATTQQVLKDLMLDDQISYEEYQLAREGKTESDFSILQKTTFKTIDDLGSLADPLLGKKKIVLNIAKQVDRAKTLRKESTDPSLTDPEKAAALFKTAAPYLYCVPFIGNIIGPLINDVAVPAMERGIHDKKKHTEDLDAALRKYAPEP